MRRLDRGFVPIAEEKQNGDRAGPGRTTPVEADSERAPTGTRTQTVRIFESANISPRTFVVVLNSPPKLRAISSRKGPPAFSETSIQKPHVERPNVGALNYLPACGMRPDMMGMAR